MNKHDTFKQGEFLFTKPYACILRGCARKDIYYKYIPFNEKRMFDYVDDHTWGNPEIDRYYHVVSQHLQLTDNIYEGFIDFNRKR